MRHVCIAKRRGGTARLAWLAAALLAARPASALRVYYIGNSLVLQAEQRKVIQALAIQAGHPLSYSMSVILGAPLSYIWQNPDASGGWEGQPYPRGLAANNVWDALVLEPYDRDFSSYPYDDPNASGYAENDVLVSDAFYRLALTGNPANQLYLYQVFPQQDMLGQVPEERTIGHAETIADQVTARHPGSPPVLIVPVGEVIVQLAALADQGALPRVANHAGLYEDAAHLNEVGTYAVALTHLSCFFRQNPQAYATKPVHPAGAAEAPGEAIWRDPVLYSVLGPNGGEVWSDTADVIKRVVWNVVSNYPRAGVSSPRGRANDETPDAASTNPSVPGSGSSSGMASADAGCSIHSGAPASSALGCRVLGFVLLVRRLNPRRLARHGRRSRNTRASHNLNTAAPSTSTVKPLSRL